MTQDVFGEIRSILGRDLSPKWRLHEIKELLKPIKDNAYLEHRVIPYVLEFLKGDTEPRDSYTWACIETPLTLLSTRLALVGPPRGDLSLKDVAQSPYVKNLTFLATYNIGLLASADVKALAESPYLTKLTHLRLLQASISDKGARIIAGSSVLQNLEKLDFSGNKIGDEGALALATSPYLTKLTKLDLTDNPITVIGAMYLQAAGLPYTL